jgi:hypothetical protein
MMKLGHAAALTGLALWLAAPAHAATVFYEATPLGGTAWRYDYAVANDGLGEALREFTVYFALGEYANLAVAGTPADWDALVAQPDADLPDDGFYDALALGAGIAPDGGLDGFSVTFDWLGAGAPGAQPFEVVDPETYATLVSGTTAQIPLPGAAWLLGAALAAAATRVRSRRTGA